MSCFADNCSIHWGVAEGPSGAAHEGTVQTDATNGSLACGDGLGAAPNAFAGLGALISPDAGNLITRHANGLFAQGIQSALKAVRSGAGSGGHDFNERTPLPANTVAVAGVGKFGDAGGWSWTNATGHDVVVIVRGQLRLKYGIIEEAFAGPADLDYRPSKRTGNLVTGATGVGGAHALTPYNMNMSIAIRRSNTTIAGGDTKNVIVQKFDPSGNIYAQGSGTEFKEEWRDFVWVEGVSAGSILTLAPHAYFEGPLQNLNILTGTADNNTDLGFSMNEVKLYALPISVAETPA